MAVYFIRAGKAGPVKIGWAADPWKRLDRLQSASPEKLSMLTILEGGREEERQLHIAFARARLQGEWFFLTDEVQQFLNDRQPAGARPKQPRKQTQRRHTRIPDPGVRAMWFDPSIATDKEVVTRTGHGFATLNKWFGPSGRHEGIMTPELARSRGQLGGKAKGRKAAERRAPEDVAALPWRDEKRFPLVEEALEHMPGWTRTTAYRLLGPRNPEDAKPARKK